MKLIKLKFKIKIRNGDYCQDIYTGEPKNKLLDVIKGLVPTIHSDEQVRQNLIYIKDLNTKEYFIYGK